MTSSDNRSGYIAMMLIVVLVLFTSSTQAGDSERPNVVLIVADDLGYCDSDLYGCNVVPTPNLKRIANEGVRFTEGYVTSPVCSPSRASLLTGRYQQRFGHEFIPSDDQFGLPLEEKTLADAMQKAGYRTGMIGKWHLGVAEQFNPVHRGFNEAFGTIGGATDYIDPTRPDVRSSRPGREPSPVVAWHGRRVPLLRGTQPVEEDEYLTEAITREALRFIENHKDDPFFLFVPHLAVHQPLQVTQAYYDRFPHISDESQRVYAAMTAALDDGVGEILDALKRHGLEKNTLLIFLSDNGAGVADYCSNEPLRLGKQTLFEGGIRVPFAMRWPGRIPAGMTYGQAVSSLDIFPTVMAAIDQVKRPEGDGVDLMPYLNGTRDDQPHKTLFWRSGANWAIRDGDWKLIHAGGRNWLYNLANDIGERSNLAVKRPDLVEQLKRRYDEWEVDMVDPAWPPRGVKSLPRFSVDGVAIEWPV